MRRCILLLMIALVAMPIAVWGNVAAGSGRPKTGFAVARINVLIRNNAGSTETVRFADHRNHPVRIVRGSKTSAAPARQPDATAAFSGKHREPVRTAPGTAVVAAVSVALPGARSIAPAAEVVSFANHPRQSVTVLRGAAVARVDVVLPMTASSSYFAMFGAARGADLDRIAFAVDGAESSHGADPGMWRPEPDGPQGPMQVSAAAALDSGGGDRFDLSQNRQLGRAYLARLFRRYGNWPDAVAAYVWGPGNLDGWIAQGRPGAGLPLVVERYCERVLRDGGLLPASGVPLSRTGWGLVTP